MKKSHPACHQRVQRERGGGGGAEAQGLVQPGLSGSSGTVGLRPRGSRQEEVQVDQKQQMQGLEKPGLAAHSSTGERRWKRCTGVEVRLSFTWGEPRGIC